jgi:hypothetical protein
MQTTANNNFVLTGFSSFKQLAELPTAVRQGEFYQQVAEELINVVHTTQALNSLGRRLVSLAHYSYTFRKMDVIEQVSQVLINLPLSRDYQSIGCYYHSFNLRREGRLAEARALLERVADDIPHWYRGRAIMSLAGLNFDCHDFHSALPLYVEAGRTATDREWRDPFTSATTQRMIAILKSTDGNHRGALADLERMSPLVCEVRRSEPYIYYEHLNSLAIELGAVGRLEEAKNVSQIVLASPFAPAYPEWRETREEIELRGRRASRSVVAFGQRTSDAEDFVRLALPADRSETGPSRTVSQLGNVLSLPVREPDRRDSADPAESIPGDQERSARVFNLEEHKKKKMSEKPNDEPKGKHTQEELNQMTTSELLVAIMNRISNDIGDYALARVLSLLDEIALENKEKS